MRLRSVLRARSAAAGAALGAERLVLAHDDAVEYYADIVGTGWTVPVAQTVARGGGGGGGGGG